MIVCMQKQIEQLFVQLELKNSKAICLTANKEKSGTSMIAQGLCERYLLAGYRTLYVDANLFNPSVISCNLALDLVEHKTNNSVFAGIAVPACTSEQMRYRDPYALQSQLAAWLKHYDRVIFDTAFLESHQQSNIPATIIASSCDATLLIVKAGSSTSENIQSALSSLQACACPFIGIVLNQFTLKTFSQAVMDSSFLCPWLPKKLKSMLQKMMNKHALFQSVV